MARFSRWATLRYSRLIAEVKQDTEVSAAVNAANNNVVTVSNTDFQSYVANTNPRLDASVSNTDFQSYVANTNPRLDALESGGGGGGVDPASSYTYSILFGGN